MDSAQPPREPDPPGRQRSTSRTWRPRLGLLTSLVIMAAFSSLIVLQLGLGRYLYQSGFVEAERRDMLGRARHAQALLEHGFGRLVQRVSNFFRPADPPADRTG